MKTVFTCLLSLLFVPSVLFSQYNQWSYPVMLTDSLTINQNAEYEHLLNNGLEMPVLFYEKTLDTSTTAIYMKPNIWDTVHLEILSEAGVCFKNPQVLKFSYYWENRSPDTLFYLFYETNRNGNWDIYYLKYHFMDGFSTPPVALLTSEKDEFNLYSNSLEALVYQVNDSIYFQHYNYQSCSFTEPQFIAGGNCCFPLIDYYQEFIAWQKGEEGHYTIEYSHFNYITLEWDNPALLTASGNNINLNISNVDAPVLTWEKQTDTVASIYTYDFWNYPDTTAYKIDFLSGVNKHDPSILAINIITKEAPLAGLKGIASFTAQLPCSLPVFANEYEGSDLFYNISLTPTICSNTNIFFNKFEGCGLYLVLTWETLHNSNKALYASQICLFLDNIESFQHQKTALTATPNPFNEQTEIQINTGSYQRLLLQVIDQHGNVCLNKKIETSLNGVFSFIWDGKNQSGEKISNGIYYCRILNQRLNKTIKIINSHI